jgi:hypothetical protein
MTMRRCSKPVGTIWRGLWRRATCTPAGARRGGSWMSSVPSPATRRSTRWVLLSHPPAEQRVSTRRGRPPSNGPAEVALLRVCWAATDGISSKRLAPFLPELLQRLRYWHALHHVARSRIQIRPSSAGREAHRVDLTGHRRTPSRVGSSPGVLGTRGQDGGGCPADLLGRSHVAYVARCTSSLERDAPISTAPRARCATPLPLQTDPRPSTPNAGASSVPVRCRTS